MKPWKAKTAKIFLSLLLLVGIERFCYVQTGGFRINKVFADLPYSPVSVPPSEEKMAEIDQILQQPFYFLGKGAQCYAFLSEDQKFVLKLFKHHHFWPDNQTLRTLPLPSFLSSWREHQLKEREKRIFSILHSCDLAFDQYREEAGLIYAHLQKTDRFKRSLKLIDKLGIAYQLDLDATEFALQKRAQLVFPHFSTLIYQHQMDRVKASIDSLVALIVNRSKKGIVNQDAIMRRNFGFVEDQAIEIDIGSFAQDEFHKKPYVFKAELMYETLELKEWLNAHSLELAAYLEQQLQDIFEKNDE
jgi:hypothetical protein